MSNIKVKVEMDYLLPTSQHHKTYFFEIPVNIDSQVLKCNEY